LKNNKKPKVELMVSFGTVKQKAKASHNPPPYHGCKLKDSYGGSFLQEKVEE
jgi:phosphomannomutase